MITRLLTLVKSQNRSVIANSAFLIANTLVGSGLGFLFWVLAARRYDSTEIGLGAAYITAMTFLVNLGEMGLGTTLIRFAPTMGIKQTSFINSSLTAIAGSTFILCVIFVVGTPLWSPELTHLINLGLYTALFLASSVIFALVQFLDAVYVAFEAGHFMFVRNLLANGLRIVLMLALEDRFGAMGLLLAVSGSALVTLILSGSVFAPRTLPNYQIRPVLAWSLLQDKLSYSLGNYFALLLWNAPPLIYPLVIVNLLGAEANAYFYMSWMVANVLFIVPVAISTATFARAANRVDMPESTFWRTMYLTLMGLVPITLGLMALSKVVLGIFGQEYVAAGHDVFLLLLVSIFPYTVNTFVIVNYRIRQNVHQVVWISGLITLLTTILIIVFGSVYHLPGIGLGWCSGQVIGVVFALYSYRGAIKTKTSWLTRPF